MGCILIIVTSHCFQIPIFPLILRLRFLLIFIILFRQPVHLPETRESKGEVGGGGGGGGDGGGGGGAPRAGSRRKARQLEVLELLKAF